MYTCSQTVLVCLIAYHVVKESNHGENGDREQQSKCVSPRTLARQYLKFQSTLWSRRPLKLLEVQSETRRWTVVSKLMCRKAYVPKKIDFARIISSRLKPNVK